MEPGCYVIPALMIQPIQAEAPKIQTFPPIPTLLNYDNK